MMNVSPTNNFSRTTDNNGQLATGHGQTTGKGSIMKTNYMIIFLVLFAAFPMTTCGAVIFSDSLDYGGSDILLNGVNATGWTTPSSTLLIYDADAGLTDVRVTGATGGALGIPGSTTSQTAQKSFTSYPMSNITAGGTVWMSALVQYVSGGTNDYFVRSTGGGSTVTDLGFGITSTGTLQLYGSDGGSANTVINTGTTGITSGTYLIVVRATKGTGTSPLDSTIDLWLDPADTTDPGTLGSVTFSTGADSKFGRDSQALDRMEVEMASGGAIDEIRFATDFSELNLYSIPEPSTAILAGLGLAGLCLRRKRRK